LIQACSFWILAAGRENAYAFASAGAHVVAVDSSEAALANGRRELAHDRIDWQKIDAQLYLQTAATFDVVVMYGLLHCLQSAEEIRSVVNGALRSTKVGGYHVVVAFNDGPHDLTAHPDFFPTLVSHDFYLNLYRGHEVLAAEDQIIHETHPHNNIPHFHSLTRLISRRTR